MLRPSEPTAAWYDGDALVLACQSSRGGHYLVRAELVKEAILITHSCPAAVHGQHCWHVDAAVKAVKELFWWLDLDKFPPLSRRHPVALKRHWRQIPVPGTELEVLELEYSA